MDFAGTLERDGSLLTPYLVLGIASGCDSEPHSWSCIEDLGPIWAQHHYEDSNILTGLDSMVTTSLGKSSSSSGARG